MNKYEIMFIVKTALGSDKIKSVIENMKKVITTGKGKVVETKEMGERKLAYPINKETNGFYVVFRVEAMPDAIKEFDRKASIDEAIIRHLTIKLDEE